MLALLAAESKSLWDPTIIGILTVLSGVVLFMGSTYLLLATNIGARLGFQVAFAGFCAIMVMMSTLWLTTSTPLNSPKGRTPQWKPINCPEDNPTCGLVSSLGDTPIGKVAQLANEAGKQPIPTEKYQGMRPAVDAALVKAAAVPGHETAESAYARYQQAGQVLTQAPVDAQGVPNKDGTETLREFWVGGDSRFVIFHNPKYAAVEICQKLPQPSDSFYPGGLDANVKPTTPGCDPNVARQWMLLVYDYGSVRLPPLMYLLSFSALLALTLYVMHSSEKAQRRAAKATALAPS